MKHLEKLAQAIEGYGTLDGSVLSVESYQATALAEKYEAGHARGNHWFLKRPKVRNFLDELEPYMSTELSESLYQHRPEPLSLEMNDTEEVTARESETKRLIAQAVDRRKGAGREDWQVFESDKRALGTIDLRSDTLAQLHRQGIETLSDLLTKSASDLVGPEFRRGRLNEVETKLAKTGHRLKEK